MSIEWDNSDMHPTVKRYINVAIDGLVQAAVLAVVVALGGVIMAISLIVFGHVRGAWMDRILGVIVGIVFVPLSVFALKLVRLKRGTAQALLEIPKGFLDYKLDAELAMLALPAILAKLTAIMNEVARSTDEHTGALQRASSTSQQLKVSEAASSSLDKYSVRADRVRVKYVEAGELLADGLSGWSKWIEESRPSKSSFAGFPEAMREFGSGLNGSNNKMRDYIATMEHGKGASRLLDAAIDRHIRPLQVILDTNRRIHAACTESLRILDGLA
jgi:hypothetical protein